jgi:hypothetical protein
MIHGGTTMIHGGTTMIHGSTTIGGMIHGGTTIGGMIHGGTTIGGMIHGGTTVINGGHSVDMNTFIGHGFMFKSLKYPDRFMHPRKSEIWLDKLEHTPGFLKLCGFSIVKGLSGTGVSFKSGKLYLSDAGGKIKLASGSSAAFKKSASFMIRYGLAAGGISFESVSMPGYYITESKYRVIVAKKVNSASWKSDATWQPATAQAQVTQQTVTQTMSQTSHITSPASCGLQCAPGAMQKVKAIGTSTEADRKKCSMKCCMTKGCAAFNYDTKSKSCALSGSSFAQSKPVPGAKTMMTCQKASAGDEPKQESEKKDEVEKEQEEDEEETNESADDDDDDEDSEAESESAAVEDVLSEDE